MADPLILHMDNFYFRLRIVFTGLAGLRHASRSVPNLKRGALFFVKPVSVLEMGRCRGGFFAATATTRKPTRPSWLSARRLSPRFVQVQTEMSSAQEPPRTMKIVLNRFPSMPNGVQVHSHTLPTMSWHPKGLTLRM